MDKITRPMFIKKADETYTPSVYLVNMYKIHGRT